MQDVAQFDWDTVKIASYDCGSLPLLADLKPHFENFIISTGATYDEEIEKTAEFMQDTSFAFLHCVTIYPTPLNDFHLARMDYLRQFAPSVGLSDHSLVERDGIKASAVALMLGADIIERHFTILEKDETKDGPVSIKPSHLKTLCDLAHGTQDQREAWVAENVGGYQEMIGTKQRPLSHVELLNRDYYRGRFAANLPNGHTIYNWENTPLE